MLGLPPSGRLNYKGLDLRVWSCGLAALPVSRQDLALLLSPRTIFFRALAAFNKAVELHPNGWNDDTRRQSMRTTMLKRGGPPLS